MERATRRLHRLTEYLPALDAGDDPVLSPELLAHPSIGDPDRRPPLQGTGQPRPTWQVQLMRPVTR